MGRNHLFWAASLFLTEALMFQSGGLVFTVAIATSVGCAWALLEERQSWPTIAWAFVPYALAAVATLGFLAASDHVSRVRALRIADALKAFDAKYHHYPETLDELVPELLDDPAGALVDLGQPVSLPSRREHRGAILSYTSRPPFGRDVYDVDARTWRWLD